MKTLLILPVLFGFVLQGGVHAQTCELRCPENIVAKADSSKTGSFVSFGAAKATGICGPLKYYPASGSFFKIGSTSVIVTAASGTKCSFTVTITDNEAPAISPLVFSVQRIWPANGKMKEVRVFYTVGDNADSSSCVLSVSGDGVSAGDWEVVDKHLVRLKANRLGGDRPKVYVISVTCRDESGNRTTRSRTISVARNISRSK
jgi:hypothetical protein